MLVDYYFFKRWVIPSLNIILYNVFSNKGGNIYLYYRNTLSYSSLPSDIEFVYPVDIIHIYYLYLGPTLYGVEPWTFYFQNLFLNFNFVFLLALLSLPVYLSLLPLYPSSSFILSLFFSLSNNPPPYLWLSTY